MARRTTDPFLVVSREAQPGDKFLAELVSLRQEAERLRRELATEQKAHQASRERVMLLERKYWQLMMSTRRLRPKG